MVLTAESRIKEGKEETNVGPSNTPRHPEVLARWDPAKARRPDIAEAPVFYPSLEEFEDTVAYIEKIRPLAEPYGICRIVPPLKWSPPFRLREKSIWEGIKFPTRVQNVELLQNRGPVMKKKKKPKARKRKRSSSSKGQPSSVSSPEEEKVFGFNSGPDFTLEEFEKYARCFKESYFEMKEGNAGDTKWSPSIEEIEGEYWRIVEHAAADEDVEVYYGADLENKVLGSGFERGETSGWDLNNLRRLSGSLLSFERGDISGVLVPWVYVGMCFSTFCWHVEDHHLYSINYNHFGEPKVWYGVPGTHATSLEKAMRKHLPELFEETPDLLHGLVTQFSPSILKDEGVPVYRAVQRAGEYVLTFPRAYHAGFNSGFNCAEAVNVATVDWLSHGQNAVELLSDENKKTSVSHDKLLLGAAYEAVRSLSGDGGESGKSLEWRCFCDKNMTLTKAVETRLRMEEARIDALGGGFRLMKMEKYFDSNCERECAKCSYDLHLTASGCSKCSPGEYACTKHANELCSCEGNDRFVLLRHTVDELRSLVRALEGEPEHLKTWASMVREVFSEAQKREPRGFDLNLEFQVDGEFDDTSETRHDEAEDLKTWASKVKEPRDFDLNLEYQVDDEFDNTSDARHDAYMLNFAASVETINLGFLVFRDLWSNKHAIYPKGFKSRVKFYNVKDPMRMSYYISEVVDVGLLGPFFTVTLEEAHQDESFSAGSAQACWEMVLQKVNEEIKKRQERNIHTLESINGLQMFGFLSPSIIQAIEALDPNHRLVEYWNLRKQGGSLEV
ncbi:lysine-specific demethylase JMJ15 [Brassica rapa]|uniref:lysine-specific demethylase JMJ15 n=1 Tax=Brassica campestris TaxID=3711 RepID=UPI00142DB0F8|nr:lysine-specific demethylase JMJ15 [Brassica rapa]